MTIKVPCPTHQKEVRYPQAIRGNIVMEKGLISANRIVYHRAKDSNAKKSAPLPVPPIYTAHGK